MSWMEINKFVCLSINGTSSTIAWFSCIKERTLNLFWVIVERIHVLSHLNIENDQSGVADVAPYVKIILMITTFLIN